MTAMLQCFRGARMPSRSHAASARDHRNWIQRCYHTIRDLITKRKDTRRMDEEQGLMTPPDVRRQTINAYGTFYGQSNIHITPAILGEALHDPDIHLGELRDYFPGFDGAPVTPVSPAVSTPTATSVRTGHLTPRPRAASRSASVYPESSAHSNSTMARPCRLQPTAESFAYKYAVIKTLKRNNEGPVHLVRHNITGKKCIIKQMRYKLHPEGFQLDPDEVYMMGHIKHRHKNIVRMLEVVDDFDRSISNMVLELCSAGDLDNLIKACRRRQQLVPAPVVLSVAAALIDATAFLHTGYDPVASRAIFRHDNRQQPMLHRDIKPGNIFLRWSDDNINGLPDPVLADFGLAGIKAHKKYDYGCGTEGYWAPEVAKADRYATGICSEKSDMYSIGVTLFELITLCETPYDPERDDIIRAFNYSTVFDQPRFLHILETCLSPNPDLRPTADELRRTSCICKQHVKAWYENGGRIPDDFWPVPFSNDRYLAGDGPQPVDQPEPVSPRPQSSPPRYSQISSPVDPDAPSMPEAVAAHPPLRRVPGHLNLHVGASAEYVQEIADIPGPFRSPPPSPEPERGVFQTDESAQATAGAQAPPRSTFSWGSDDDRA